MTLPLQSWFQSWFNFACIANELPATMHWGLLTLVGTFLFPSDFVVEWSESRQTTIIAEQLTRSLNRDLNCIVNTTTGFRMPASRIGHRAPAKANAPQALGFKCLNCSGEFSSRTAMDCHRRYQTSIGTPCADPEQYQSLSFTPRADLSTGILRHHPAGTLGESIHNSDKNTFNTQII